MANRQDSGGEAALGAADWLSLAAAPTFAVMALLTSVNGGGQSDILCASAEGASPLNAMMPMYVLMSAFHTAPWLKLIAGWRATTSASDPALGGDNKGMP
ncbi:hypothetical protein AB4099_23160 [Bosea sp. 2KB_26]|uniref:hypothetical protein n=1 Tax=Bosea sp. 2KB_26 TaxID=3237475 RepID=UPI000DE2BA0D